MKLEGKVALITGAARGIGKEYAKVLLERGAKVSLVDLLVEEGRQSEEEFKRVHGDEAVIFLQRDINKKDQLKGVFDETLSVFGRLDIMINNAGIVGQGRDDFQRVIDINVTALIRGTYLAMDRMNKEKGGNGGVIINVSSTVGFEKPPGAPAYIASKHAVLGFSKAYGGMISKDESSSGVRLNCLCPTFVPTDLMGGRDTQAIHKDPSRTLFLKYGGWLEKDVLAKAMLQLVEDDEVHNEALLVTQEKQEFLKL